MHNSRELIPVFKVMMSFAPRKFVYGVAFVGIALPTYMNYQKTYNEPPKSTNPLDCNIPACSDKMDMFKKAVGGVRNNSTQQSKSGAMGAKGSPMLPVIGCPLDRNELGRSAWDLLHTMAANYPDNPTEKQQKQMAAFFEALAEFYPCIHCAEDFQENVRLSPPRVKSRTELSLWLCAQHNEVNKKLGKPLFIADIKVLDDRWRVSQRKECNPVAEIVEIGGGQAEEAMIEAFIADLENSSVGENK